MNSTTRTFALAAVLGLTVGALSIATVASAQSYGGDSDATVESSSIDETTDVAEATEVDAGAGTLVQVQDGADAPEDGTADDGERRQRGRRGGCNLEAAATAIGIDEADLRAELDNGSTIADVAEANGVDVDDVIDAMVDAKAERLADKVEDGRLTQAEADEKLADAEDRITDRVNGADDDDA